MRAAVVHGMISPSDGERFLHRDLSANPKASLFAGFREKRTVPNVCSVRQLALQAHAPWNKVCRSSNIRIPPELFTVVVSLERAVRSQPLAAPVRRVKHSVHSHFTYREVRCGTLVAFCNSFSFPSPPAQAINVSAFT